MNDDKKENICAVVVTYNRKELLSQCLNGLLNQTHPINAIYIIDNASTDGTPQILEEKGYIKEYFSSINEPKEKENIINMLSEGNQDKKVKIHYVQMHENTGSAGGFHEGVKRVYEKGYDWIWVMDDDVVPKVDCLRNLINATQENNTKLTAFLPVREDLKGNKINWYPFFSKLILRSWNAAKIKSNTIYFEGLLVSKMLIDKIGFPNKDFFTVLDDTEYGLRISSVGKTRYVETAILVRLLEVPHYHSPIKRYYCFRNLFLLSKLQRIPFLWTVIIVFIQVFFSICKTLFFFTGKENKYIVRTLVKAYLDGFNNKFGIQNKEFKMTPW